MESIGTMGRCNGMGMEGGEFLDGSVAVKNGIQSQIGKALGHDLVHSAAISARGSFWTTG